MLAAVDAVDAFDAPADAAVSRFSAAPVSADALIRLPFRARRIEMTLP